MADYIKKSNLSFVINVKIKKKLIKNELKWYKLKKVKLYKKKEIFNSFNIQ